MFGKQPPMADLLSPPNHGSLPGSQQHSGNPRGWPRCHSHKQSRPKHQNCTPLGRQERVFKNPLSPTTPGYRVKKKIIWVCNYTASKKRGEGHGRALRKAACPALSSHLSKNPRRTASGYNKTSLLGCLSPPPSALAPPFLHTHTHARAHTHNHTRNLKEDPISTINT